MNSKKLSILEIFGGLKPQIAFFTETMLKTANGIDIEGYTFFGRQRKNKSCGGVGIMVNNEIKTHVTPHETNRDIEICWISVQRKEARPIFMAVYYGRQETRNNREEMLKEMDNLAEEIREKMEEGEVIVFMDGNGKIGLLGEEISRNGKLLIDVFEECDLQIMNQSDKCNGKVTRQNRRNEDQKSAIDFLVVTDEAEQRIDEFLIDEKGDFLLRGKAPSDHNSFIVKLNVGHVKQVKQPKVVRWRLNAPANKWSDFRSGLAKNSEHCSKIMQSTDGGEVDILYKKWKATIESTAFESIGKTTVKIGKGKGESVVVRSIRAEKRTYRKAFEEEQDWDKKPILKKAYIKKQKELRQQIEIEYCEKVQERFENMASQGTNGFWKEMKKHKRDNLSGWTGIKDNEGQRIMDPEMQKQKIARYYAELYSFDKGLEPHPFHKEVKKRFAECLVDMGYEDQWYNLLPSKKTIAKIIQSKKNRKATTDFPNELLKKGGEEFIDCLYPVIANFWKNEVPPKEWNLGVISSIYKGKGDRERLQFQRGITVSSTVSMIIEEVINQRMTEIVPMTQAQGGGKKGASTRDHVFLLRGAMTYALKNKLKMYVTFYDVTKAYDRADVQDMLLTVWEKGLKGKLWRLMAALNTNLTAKVKTRHGMTEEIERIAGGKQGGKNFGFLFAKMMDVLAEDVAKDEKVGVRIENLLLAALEWVDDVVTFAVGDEQQKLTMNHVDQFAVKHKLKWGRDKCNVMEVTSGKHTERKWNLGNLEIDSCTQYKYLGDWVMCNGSNKKNFEDREVKVMTVTRKIIAMCGTDVIRKIHMKALLKMHETCTIPTLLSNCESWIINSTERGKIQRIELWALKKLLNVPKTTPTPAIWHVTGLLMTDIHIDKRQLLYLKTILDRPTDDWTKQMLLVLKKNDIGWARQINKLLEAYKLETCWEEIANKTPTAWKTAVIKETEIRNKEKLVLMCQSVKGEKSKTKRVLHELMSDNYERKALPNLFRKSRFKCRVQIMTMFGMLQCSKNYKYGYGGDGCNECGVIDDENHRINHCYKYRKHNLYNSPIKYDFRCIFSGDEKTISRTLEVIMHVWNLEDGKNEMFM